MKDNILYLFLYPVATLPISETKKTQIADIIAKNYKSINLNEFDEVLSKPIHEDDLSKIIFELKDKDKMQIFNTAKSILELFNYSKDEILKIQFIAKSLNINPEKTGFTFDIFNEDDINQFEFLNTVRKYSMVSAAIGFIPLPVADIAILTPIQIGLVAKIANIYNHKIEPKEFLKMLAGIIGAGIVFRTVTRIINSFIPFLGWGINAAVAYSGTYALGIITKRYLEANGQLTNETIKDIWNKSYLDGKKEFQNLKDFILKKKDELVKQFEKFKNTQENDTYNDGISDEELSSDKDFDTEIEKPLEETKPRKKSKN
jgi:uncharacterized protein (DUF697 family)